MAQKDSISYGSDVSPGKYECRDCGKVIAVSKAFRRFLLAMAQVSIRKNVGNA
ncbi:hypothetical protein [Nitratidesulfovibrio oxamicus]|uniref:hypothetical protein n=1 Tax=Nitratidesulfovibrio oxamicus TaxID=32016 RepID=UPI0018C85320|nr:hypothetical protein [Nitratidesulfovibrio oxamicus]